MKTLKQFENQPEGKEISLDEFLGTTPIEINKHLYLKICSHNEAHAAFKISSEHFISQERDAIGVVRDNYKNKIYTYITVASYPGDKYWYLGIIPCLKGEGF